MLEKSAIQQDSLQNYSERNDTQGKKLFQDHILPEC